MLPKISRVSIRSVGSISNGDLYKEEFELIAVSDPEKVKELSSSVIYGNQYSRLQLSKLVYS